MSTSTWPSSFPCFSTNVFVSASCVFACVCVHACMNVKKAEKTENHFESISQRITKYTESKLLPPSFPSVSPATDRLWILTIEPSSNSYMGLTVCIHVIVSPLSRNICVVSIPLRSSPLAHKHAVLTTSGSHSFLSLSLQKHPLKDLSMFALFKSSLPFPLESIPIRLFGPCSPHH